MADDDKSTWTKIEFRQEVEDLFRYGPSTPVGIAAISGECTDKIKVLAQFDTGAAGTVVSPRLVERLKLEPIGSGATQEAGREPITANFYFVRLFLTGMEIELEVVGLPFLSKPHDVLIGRDVMANSTFTVDFTTGSSLFHFKLPVEDD